MDLKRKIELLHNSSERMKSAAEEMKTIQETAAAAGKSTPIILRWWVFMRHESWLHLKLSIKIWWHIIKGERGV